MASTTENYPQPPRSIADLANMGEYEEEEEELFEIDLEFVNSIPPPHYWDLNSMLGVDSKFSNFTVTSNALLANCLLPISDLSNAIPIASKAPANPSVIVLSESVSLKFLGFPAFGAISMILN
ncbi:WAT1-related protein [Actinidia chinensis var. chinensis]|uniref:WAT1-related protein n=1 Tax=Actinidia chinensis var. chinensis TaxID=1590841 RepID=A0A2R6PXM4_ACTCC|nr:WAT1-related protein [Actinidia chinensis var. chinensis]